MTRERLERVPPAWAAIHRINAGAMLLSEARALRALRDAATRATAVLVDAADRSGDGRALLREVRHVATTLQAHIGRAIHEARADARKVARRRLDAELGQVERELAALGHPIHVGRPPLSDGAEDGARADAAAASFAAAWSTAVTAAILAWLDDERGRLTARVRDAAKTQTYRIERISTTEVATAYNDEHDEGVGWVAKEHAGAKWLAAIFKRWDAKLDRLTCPVCRDHDGELAIPGFDFHGGDEPAEVHPSCRCQDSLVFLPLRLSGGSEGGSYTGTDTDTDDGD